MKLNTSTSSLFTLSSLFLLASSLPFAPRKAVLEPVVRRATYSVVPVDGGPAPFNDDDPATVFETIIQTPTPTTTTLVKTNTLPASTDYVLTTKTIKGLDTTKTLVITITPSPTTATSIKYSVIDVDSPSTTTVTKAPLVFTTKSTSTPSQGPSSIVIPKVSPSYTTPIAAIIPTAILTIASISSIPASLSISSSFAIDSVPSLSPTPISPSTTSESSPATVSASSIVTQSDTTIVATSTSSLDSSIYTSIFSLVSLTDTIASTTTSIAVSIPSTTYDNGQWHTTYPSWSNTTMTQTSSIQVAQTTSLA